MRNVFVQCKCDACGKEAITSSLYNHWHHLYEDTLPEGWRQFDNEEFPWIEFNGDQCPDCQASFILSIQRAFESWKKFVVSCDQLGQSTAHAGNDDEHDTS